MSPYVGHFAYLLILCAFLARDALLLRGLLLCSQVIIVIYTLTTGVPLIAGWNTLYACINLVWVVLILRERRAVHLPEDLRRIHERHFAALTPSEFLRWWKQGRREVLRDVVMARTGEAPESLFFVLKGTVRVSHGESVVTNLPAGFFVAEMSLLTGELPTADAVAVGEIEVMCWSAKELRSLTDRNPKFWSKIQSVLGHDLVEKIKRTTPAPIPA